MIDITSDEFLAHLTTALVEVEETKLDPDCLSDACGHDECPDPGGIGCGDAAALRDELVKVSLCKDSRP